MHNEDVLLKIKRLSAYATIPKYMSNGAAGLDLSAAFNPEKETENVKGGKFQIYSKDWAIVPTGLAVEIQPGYEGQVRSRSGLAARRGIHVLNSPGTIDSDYRGEIHVVLANFGLGIFSLSPGDRIAQLVITPVIRANIVEVEDFGETVRGAGGLGSTGI